MKSGRSIRIRNALLFGRLKCFNCLDISSLIQGYVDKANMNVELIPTTKQVFDPGGKWVFDLWGCDDKNVVNKHDVDTSFKLQLASVGKSNVLIAKLFLRQEECDNEFIRNLLDHEDILSLDGNKNIMGAHFWKFDVTELMGS